MSSECSKKSRWLPVTICLLSVFRIFISTKIPLSMYTNQVHDDQLLFRYAECLLAGKWLGEYNYLTLVKGISFPLFLAVCSSLFIPYTIGLSLLNIGSAAVFVRAMKDKFENRIVPSIIYVLLIYSPVGFSAMISQRAYRMAIVPYAAILVFGCFIGLYFRRDQEIRVLLPWSIGSGLSLAFFWFIREDSIWIMPFVAVVLLLLIVQLFLHRKNIKKIILRLVLYFLPTLVLVTADLTQRAINYSYYGIFSTNDRSDTEFGKTMSYLYKIEDEQAADDVWVSNQTIEKVMSVSPTFASIRTEITDSLAAWMGGQDACGDVILWALRDAATWAGYYEDAVTANQFWGKVNDEIKEAIENGSLKTDHLIRFSSMSKGTTWSKIPFFIKKTLKGMFSVGMYKDTGLSYDNKSAGEMEDIRKFEALLGSFGNYPQISDSISTYTQNAIKVGNSIVGVFKGLAPFSFVLAILGYLIATVHILRHLVKMHKFDGMIDMWLVIIALLLSSLVLTFGVMFFCSWFPPRMSVYLNFYNAGSYALLQIAKYLAIYCGVKLTVNYLKKSKHFRPLEG